MSFHAPVLKPTNEKESEVIDFPDFSFLCFLILRTTKQKMLTLVVVSLVGSGSGQ